MSKNDTSNVTNIDKNLREISIFDRNSLLQEHMTKGNNVQVTQSKEKDSQFSFGDIDFSKNTPDQSKFKIGNTDVTNNKKDDSSKSKFGVSNEGSLNIEGKKIVDNNATWKTGLNKQEDINLAIISNNNNKKKEVDLFDQIGDLGSVSFKEKMEVKQEYKSEYVDEFEESSNKNNLNNLSKQQTMDDANTKLEKLLNSGGEIKFDEQGRYFDVNTGKWILPDYSKQNQELFDRIKKLRSSLDNKGDISGMLKWKNNTGKINLDKPMPDFSKVKGKLNTGIISKKFTDEKFQNEADQMKKQIEEFNKNNKNMDKYRNEAIKLEKDKLNNSDTLRKELRTNLASKITK